MKKIPKTKGTKINKKISEKHKLLLNKLSENIGIPMVEAMKAVGYSESYAENSQVLKETKSWKKLLETYLPEDSIAKRHRELLDKEEILVIDKEEVRTGQPHADTKYAIDMAYKLYGKYTPEEVNVKYNPYTKEQLVEMILGKIEKK